MGGWRGNCMEPRANRNINRSSRFGSKELAMADNEREQLKQRRRALIKAAGAAPVVFSLTSGSAVAATSLTCKDKSQSLAQIQQPAGATQGSPDTWMRYKVDAYSIPQPNADVLGFQYPTGTWYKVVSGVASRVTLQSNGNGQGTLPTSTGGFYYLLVNYSSGQSFDAVYVGQTIQNPIAGASCWNSLTGGTSATNPPNLVN